MSTKNIPPENCSMPHIMLRKRCGEKESVALIQQLRCGLFGCAEEKNQQCCNYHSCRPDSAHRPMPVCHGPLGRYLAGSPVYVHQNTNRIKSCLPDRQEQLWPFARISHKDRRERPISAVATGKRRLRGTVLNTLGGILISMSRMFLGL